MIKKNVATASLPGQSNRDWSADTSPTCLMSAQEVYFDKSFYRTKIPSHHAIFHNPQPVQPYFITMTTYIP